MRRAHSRASCPSKKPIRTPGPRPASADGGELSKTTLTGPVSEAAWPLRPALRQNGSSYTAKALITDPAGIRWVSWSRHDGSGGSYSSRPASVGGRVTTTWSPAKVRPSRV